MINMKSISIVYLSYDLVNKFKQCFTILQLFPLDSNILSERQNVFHRSRKLRKLRKLRKFLKGTRLTGPLPGIVELTNNC